MPSHERSALLQHIKPADQDGIDKLLGGEDFSTSTVPIVLTSAVDGQGLRQLHALLRSLSVPAEAPSIAGTSSADSTLFRVDEVFAIPPSKVYESRAHNARPGAVLCGYVATGSIRIGDELLLGPFTQSTEDAHATGQAVDTPPIKTQPTLRVEDESVSTEAKPHWSTVRVVSLRNLRLPTHSLLPGQVGTIGVEPTSPTVDLRRGRKGMVLTSRSHSRHLHTCWTFAALFAAADFSAQTSPPLLLAGYATVYINTVRARVRVTAVILDDADGHAGAETEGEVFTFDGDTERRDRAIRISFRFQSHVEALTEGDRVLVVPHAVAPGPATGGPWPVGVTGASGGFIGRVCGFDT